VTVNYKAILLDISHGSAQHIIQDVLVPVPQCVCKVGATAADS
jgi:hypothetical protein